MAMGLAAPAQADFRRDGSAASAASLDTVLVAASARRLRARGADAERARGADPEVDGRGPGQDHSPFAPFHLLWLTAAAPLPASPSITGHTAVLAPPWAPSALVLGSRTSRGPPIRS